MKETKVYIDELPESCFECPIMVDGSEGCDFCVCAILEEKATTKNRLKDCPLKSLHDRELVNEVCGKIRSDLQSGLKKFKPKPDDVLTQFIYNLDNKLDQIEKEFEK